MDLSEFLPKETLDERELYLKLMHKYQLIFTPGNAIFNLSIRLFTLFIGENM